MRSYSPASILQNKKSNIRLNLVLRSYCLPRFSLQLQRMEHQKPIPGSSWLLVQLEPKNPWHITLDRLSRFCRRVCHQEKMREGCANVSTIHIWKCQETRWAPTNKSDCVHMWKSSVQDNKFTSQDPLCGPPYNQTNQLTLPSWHQHQPLKRDILTLYNWYSSKLD